MKSLPLAQSLPLHLQSTLGPTSRRRNSRGSSASEDDLSVCPRSPSCQTPFSPSSSLTVFDILESRRNLPLNPSPPATLVSGGGGGGDGDGGGGGGGGGARPLEIARIVSTGNVSDREGVDVEMNVGDNPGAEGVAGDVNCGGNSEDSSSCLSGTVSPPQTLHLSHSDTRSIAASSKCSGATMTTATSSMSSSSDVAIAVREPSPAHIASVAACKAQQQQHHHQQQQRGGVAAPACVGSREGQGSRDDVLERLDDVSACAGRDSSSSGGPSGGGGAAMMSIAVGNDNGNEGGIEMDFVLDLDD